MRRKRGEQNQYSDVVFCQTRVMFQLINGTIECGQCRHEIRHGDEFICNYCGASLCDSCLFYHEEECYLASGLRAES